MYKAQVLDKIAKGKGYEVLRNKVISHISEVETHIKNVTGEEFVFSESEKDDKTYISIKVNGKDIFFIRKWILATNGDFLFDGIS